MNLFNVWNPGDQFLIGMVNVLLQVTAITAIALAVSSLLRRSPAVRYWILCTSLFVVFASPAIVAAMQWTGRGLLSVSLMRETPTPLDDGHMAVTEPVEKTVLPAAFAVGPEKNTGAMDAGLPFREEPGMELMVGEGATLPVTPAEIDATPATLMAAGTVEVSIPNVRREPTVLGRVLHRVVPPVLLLWLSGSTILLLRLVIGWCRLGTILRTAQPNPPANLVDLFQQVGQQLRVSRMPELVFSNRVKGPFSAGLIRPRVVLPEGFVDRVTANQLRDVLIHEVAHIVRRDQWVVLLQNLTAALYWLHPLARSLNRQLAQAREEVCDNYVLAATDAPSYSRTLLTLARMSTPSLPGTVGLFTSGWKLESRVAGLLDERRNRLIHPTIKGAAFVLSLSVMLFLIAASGTLSLAIGQSGVPEVSSKTPDVAQNDDKKSREASAPESDQSPNTSSKLKPAAITSLRGKVVDTKGSTVTSGEVRLFRQLSNAPKRQLTAMVATDGSGQFELNYQPDEFYGPSNYLILVTAAGHGADWLSVSDVDPNEPITMRLAEDDVPIEGTIVDLEGKPVVGATLTVHTIRVTNDSDLSQYLTALKVGNGPEFQFDKLLRDPPHLSPETTDANGKFRLKGIGRERMVELQIAGPAIHHASFQVVTRRTEMIADQRERDDRFFTMDFRNSVHGATFSYVTQPSRPVVGTVVDSKTKLPLRQIKVQTPEGTSSAITDDAGRFELAGLAKGRNYRMMAFTTDEQPYLCASLNASDQPGLQPLDVTIEMTRGIEVRGRVTDKTTGRPLSARVHYYPVPPNEYMTKGIGFGEALAAGAITTGFTQPDGTYKLCVLPGPGMIAVDANDGDNYQTANVDALAFFSQQKVPYPRGNPEVERMLVNVLMSSDGQSAVQQSNFQAIELLNVAPDAKNLSQNFELIEGAAVTGKVLDPDGGPLEGTLVYGLDTLRYSNYETLRNSGFVARGLRANEKRRPYFVHEGRKLVGAVSLSARTQQPVTVRLQPWGEVKGRLFDVDGAPLANVMFGIWSQPNPSKRGALPEVPLYTDERGYFSVTGLLPGDDYRFEAYHRRKHWPLFQLNLQPGETIDLGDVRIDRSVQSGVMLDTKNAPKADDTSSTASNASATEARADDPVATTPLRGIVVDAKGAPVAGAEVRLFRHLPNEPERKLSAMVSTDGSGQFELNYQPDDFHGSTADLILVTAVGHGVDWLSVKDIEPNTPITLRLAEDDIPIEGTIVDLEGKPVVGATLTVQSIRAMNDGDLTRYLNALKAGSGPNFRFDKRIDYPDLVAQTTDVNGKFRLTGIGRGRLVELRVAERAIQHTRFQVVTSQTETITYNSDQPGALKDDPQNSVYGATFSHVAQPSRTIVGTVVDSKTKQPLRRINVQTLGGSSPAMTDEVGRFELAGVAKGPNYRMIARPSAEQPYLPASLNASDQPGLQPLDVTIEMTRGIEVRGRVTDQKTGRPLSARVIYYALSPNPFLAKGVGFSEAMVGGPLSTGFTDRDGTYSVFVLPGPGMIAVNAHDGDNYQTANVDAHAFFAEQKVPYAPGVRSLNRSTICVSMAPESLSFVPQSTFHVIELLNLPPDANELSLDFQLFEGTAVTGQLLDPEGQPLDGVRAYGLKSNSFSHPETLRSSGFVARGLRVDESRRPYFRHDGRKLVGAVILSTQVNQPLTVQLQPWGEVNGRLLDVDGAAMANQELRCSVVSVEQNRGAYPSEAISTDDAGSFAIKGLLPGKQYSFEAFRQMRSWPLFQLNLQPGETLDLGDVRIDRPVEAATTKAAQSDAITVTATTSLLRGTVFGPDGRPKAAKLWRGGPVRAGRFNNSPQAVQWIEVSQTDADGRFEVTMDIPKGDGPRQNGPPRTVRLAATADGLGFAWADVTIDEPQNEIELRLVDDLPIEGQIVTPDGQPAGGVQILIESLTQAIADVDQIVKNAPLSTGIITKWPTWPGGGPTTPEKILTDAQGRFRVTGLGKGRFVHFEISGGGIGSARLQILTRDPTPDTKKHGAIALREGLAWSTYFARFTHVATPGRTLRGIVSDAETGQPVAGVRVTAPSSWASRRQPTVTAADGSYEITGIPEAKTLELELEPTKSPHFNKRWTIQDPSGLEPIKCDIMLVQGIRLRGRVTDANTGKAVQGTVVYNALYPNELVERLIGPDGNSRAANPAASAKIQEDGSYEISVLPGPGVIAASVSGQSYVTAHLRADEVKKLVTERVVADDNGEVRHLSPALGGQSRGIMALASYHAAALLSPARDVETMTIDLTVLPGQMRKGTIVDPEGKPLPGVEVIGLDVAGTSRSQPLDSADFTIEGLASGRSRTIVFLHRERSLGAKVVVDGNDVSPLIVKLSPTGTISGRLLDRVGEPLDTFVLDIGEFRDGTVYMAGDFWTTKIDADGRFQVTDLVGDCNYFVQAVLPDMPMPVFVARASVSPGESIDLGDFRQQAENRFVPVKQAVGTPSAK